MSGYANVTIDMVYAEIKQVNQRVAILEHLLIPEEKISPEEHKELDRLIADAKAGSAIPFSKVRK